MTVAWVHAMRLGLIVSLVAGSLLLPVTSGAVLAPLSISVSASNGMFTSHVTSIGAEIFICAHVTFGDMTV